MRQWILPYFLSVYSFLPYNSATTIGVLVYIVKKHVFLIRKKKYVSVELSIGVLDVLIFILFTLEARVFGPFHVHIHVLRLGAG